MADIMRLTQGKKCTISERKCLIFVLTEDFSCSLVEHHPYPRREAGSLLPPVADFINPARRERISRLSASCRRKEALADSFWIDTRRQRFSLCRDHHNDLNRPRGQRNLHVYPQVPVCSDDGFCF